MNANPFAKAELFMEEALKEAVLAEEKGEIPIGAVVVKDGTVIGRGHNSRETENSLLSHAEVNAIVQACHELGSWHLEDCDLYVTLEPCPMCSGAILQARMKRVFFGACSEREGCGGTVLNLLDYPGMNWHVECWGGIRAEECSELLSRFFEKLH